MNDIRKCFRSKELAKYLGVSEITLWRWRRDGHLPEPAKLGPKLIVWDADVIETWLKKNT